LPYRVNIESFEGPFELLLALVSEQKLDIGRISIAEVADQYLAYVDSHRELDMDVASDFLVVASTLLALKTAALLPEAPLGVEDEDLEEYTPERAREILISRLLTYKQFKNVAATLASRLETESRMHARAAGVESEFIGLLPDYLAGVTLHSLAVICADLAARRQVFLLEAEHVISRSLALEKVAGLLLERLQTAGTLRFEQLYRGEAYPRVVVVAFLTLLELYHRGMIDLDQPSDAAQITVAFRPAVEWTPAADQSEPTAPIDEYLKTLEAG